MSIDRYPRNPLWKRLLFEVLLATLSPIVLAMFAIPYGGLANYEPTRETLLWTLALLGGAWLVGFAIAVYLYEMRWQSHPMWFMQEDDDDPDRHNPDVHA